MINLFPPFLFQEETNDFDEVWENFCREILKLENKSNNFIKRVPPENGVDIFFEDKKIAYQCKSSIYGTSRGHNLTKIVNSYNDALKIKNDLGWQKYVLCINYDLTGIQESNLKKEIPNIEVLAGSYWIDKAKKYFAILKDYFRLVISLKKDRVNNAISNTFVPEYSEKLKKLLEIDSFKIYVWCNRNTSLYELLVSPEFIIEDLLYIIKKSWPYPLPEPTVIGPYKVGLSYSIVYNEQKQPFKKNIKEVGIKENGIITLWTTITYSDNENNRRSGNYIEMMTGNRISHRMTANEAIEKYSETIRKRFKDIDEKLMNE